MKRHQFSFSLEVLFILIAYCAIEFAFLSAQAHRQVHEDRLRQLEFRLDSAYNNQTLIQRTIGGTSFDAFANDPNWLKAHSEVVAIRKQLHDEQNR
jgi:hypothetical protein